MLDPCRTPPPRLAFGAVWRRRMSQTSPRLARVPPRHRRVANTKNRPLRAPTGSAPSGIYRAVAGRKRKRVASVTLSKTAAFAGGARLGRAVNRFGRQRLIPGLPGATNASRPTVPLRGAAWPFGRRLRAALELPILRTDPFAPDRYFTMLNPSLRLNPVELIPVGAWRSGKTDRPRGVRQRLQRDPIDQVTRELQMIDVADRALEVESQEAV